MLTPACWWVAAPIAEWTPELHRYRTWMFGLHDVSGGVDQLLAHDVPRSIWPFMWSALCLGDVVGQYRYQVSVKVREGLGWWYSGAPLAEAPLTEVEKEVKGKMATLLAVFVTYGEVGCVMKAYMALSLKALQLNATREGYVEDAIDDQGQGYRRVVWPTLEAPEGPESWSRIAPPVLNKRTSELLCNAVFSVA
jgi:hypothetical protein